MLFYIILHPPTHQTFSYIIFPDFTPPPLLLPFLTSPSLTLLLFPFLSSPHLTFPLLTFYR